VKPIRLGEIKSTTWEPLFAFLAAEGLKLRHSRTARVALIAMAVTPATLNALLGWIGAEYSVFPDVLTAVGAVMWMLVGITSVLLVTDWVGGEFEGGTVHVVAARGTPRWAFVVGKGVILLGASLVNGLVCLLSGGMVAVISHLANVGTEGLGEGVAALFVSGLGAVGVMLLAAAAYTGMGLVMVVLTRSSTYALLGGLGLYMADLVFEGFDGFGVPELNLDLGTLSIMGNTNVLLTSLPDPMLPVWSVMDNTVREPASAVLSLVCFTLAGTALSIALFQRQDLTGE
jgi:ABC-type transport system involved in multi-copper enzyme maturation permease subunit